jgi:hypothetical protein
MYTLRCMLVVYSHPIPAGRGSVMGHWALSSVLHALKIIIEVFLHQRLQQDVDLITSWLTNVTQAREEQLQFREHAAKAAKNFFLPIWKPNPISTTSASSLTSTKTYAWEDSSHSDTSITTKTYFNETDTTTKGQLSMTMEDAKRCSVRQ